MKVGLKKRVPILTNLRSVTSCYCIM